MIASMDAFNQFHKLCGYFFCFVFLFLLISLFINWIQKLTHIHVERLQLQSPQNENKFYETLNMLYYLYLRKGVNRGVC